jgi:hypothetical protein
MEPMLPPTGASTSRTEYQGWVVDGVLHVPGRGVLQPSHCPWCGAPSYHMCL